MTQHLVYVLCPSHRLGTYLVIQPYYLLCSIVCAVTLIATDNFPAPFDMLQ